MPISESLRAWRVSRRHSIEALAAKAGLPGSTIEAIEAAQFDPPLSMIEALAGGLGIPVSWVHTDPKQIDLLMDGGDDGAGGSGVEIDGADPVIERILIAAHAERELYTLLTCLLQSGDPKLIRAAEVSLRSLVKQSRQATVPWQSRPPGHFEPPSD